MIFSGDPDQICQETQTFCDFSGGGGGSGPPVPPPPPSGAVYGSIEARYLYPSL